MSDFDLRTPGVWFGPRGCQFSFPSTREWGEVSDAVAQFKLGDFSGREGFAQRSFEFEDPDARQVGVFAAMCVANTRVLEAMRGIAESAEDLAVDFSLFASYSLIPQARDIVSALADRYRYTESSEIIFQCLEEISSGCGSEFCWRSKPVYIGDLCVEVQQVLQLCRIEGRPFLRADLATILSTHVGTLFPIPYGKLVQPGDMKSVMEFVQMIAAQRHRYARGEKYFYGFAVS